LNSFNVIGPVRARKVGGSVSGSGRLLEEVLAGALSVYGWRVHDLQNSRLSSAAEADIALIGGFAEGQTVIERIRYVRAEFPRTKIVLLGIECTDADLVRFIGEGANSYLPRTHGLADLVATLEMVRNNQACCSGQVTQMVLNSINRLSNERSNLSDAALTAREKEILRLISDGLSNKEIANQLGITPNTVKNHVHHLLEKLKLASRHEAACLQIRPARSVTALSKIARFSGAS
jgi:DNA-binding NarL/FixJ family response regulator